MTEVLTPERDAVIEPGELHIFSINLGTLHSEPGFICGGLLRCEDCNLIKCSLCGEIFTLFEEKK